MEQSQNEDKCSTLPITYDSPWIINAGYFLMLVSLFFPQLYRDSDTVCNIGERSLSLGNPIRGNNRVCAVLGLLFYSGKNLVVIYEVVVSTNIFYKLWKPLQPFGLTKFKIHMTSLFTVIALDVVAFVQGLIDADAPSGTCFLGLTQPTYLIVLDVVPTIIGLIVIVVTLIISVHSLQRELNVLQMAELLTSDLIVLINRIIVFVALNALTLGAMVFVQFGWILHYNQLQRDLKKWWDCKQGSKCKFPHTSAPIVGYAVFSGGALLSNIAILILTCNSRQVSRWRKGSEYVSSSVRSSISSVAHAVSGHRWEPNLTDVKEEEDEDELTAKKIPPPENKEKTIMQRKERIASASPEPKIATPKGYKNLTTVQSYSSLGLTQTDSKTNLTKPESIPELEKQDTFILHEDDPLDIDDLRRQSQLNKNKSVSKKVTFAPIESASEREDSSEFMRMKPADDGDSGRSPSVRTNLRNLSKDAFHEIIQHGSMSNTIQRVETFSRTEDFRNAQDFDTGTFASMPDAERLIGEELDQIKKRGSMTAIHSQVAATHFTRASTDGVLLQLRKEKIQEEAKAQSEESSHGGHVAHAKTMEVRILQDDREIEDDLHSRSPTTFGSFWNRLKYRLTPSSTMRQTSSPIKGHTGTYTFTQELLEFKDDASEQPLSVVSDEMQKNRSMLGHHRKKMVAMSFDGSQTWASHDFANSITHDDIVTVFDSCDGGQLDRPQTLTRTPSFPVLLAQKTIHSLHEMGI